MPFWAISLPRASSTCWDDPLRRLAMCRAYCQLAKYRSFRLVKNAGRPYCNDDSLAKRRQGVYRVGDTQQGQEDQLQLHAKTHPAGTGQSGSSQVYHPRRIRRGQRVRLAKAPNLEKNHMSEKNIFWF